MMDDYPSEEEVEPCPRDLLNASGGTSSWKKRLEYMNVMAKMAGFQREVQREKGWAEIGNKLSEMEIPSLPESQKACGESMKVGLVNAQSMNDKIPDIFNLITGKGLDLLNISEAWLTDRIVEEIQNACRPNYGFDHQDREMGNGGGVACIFKKEFGYQAVFKHSARTFDFLAFELKKAQPILVIQVYRPPPTEERGIRIAEFFIEFAEVFRPLALKYDCILMTGDFNINVGNDSLGSTRLFKVFLWLFGLEQRVQQVTYPASGRTLDLVVTRNVQIPNLEVDARNRIADHYNVLFHATPNYYIDSRQWMTEATARLENILY